MKIIYNNHNLHQHPLVWLWSVAGERVAKTENYKNKTTSFFPYLLLQIQIWFFSLFGDNNKLGIFLLL